MNLLDMFKSSFTKKYEQALIEETQKTAKLQAVYTEELQKISGKNVAGGVPNTVWNSGDVTDAFGFPQNFAITAKKMDNTSICTNILDFYKSSISGFKWSIGYKDEKLNDDPIHSEITKDLVEMFERMGGLDAFIGAAVRDFMKYGLVLINPTLEFKARKFAGKKILKPIINNFRLLDPQSILAFYADEKDNWKTAAVRYLSLPKAVYNSETGDIDTGESGEVIIDFNKSLSCICTLNYAGDPLGQSLLKPIWSQWRVLNNMDVSFNSNLITVGEHSYQFEPNQLFFDNHQEALTSVLSDVNRFYAQGGGAFVSKYGKLVKLESMDLSKYHDYQQGMNTEIARRCGLNIEILGQSSGASRNLAQFAQADFLVRAYDIARQFSYQFSEGFIKRYVETTYAALNFTKRIKDTPHLMFELEEGTPESITKKVEAEIKAEESLAALEINNNGVITQSGSKTWIKSSPTDDEAIVIDTAALDRVLVDAEERFAEYYQSEMKRYLNDPEKIKEAVNNPNNVINKRTLTREQEEAFNNGLNTILYNTILAFMLEETRRYDRALAVQGKTFQKEFGYTPEAYASRQTQKIMRTKQVKDLKRNQLASFINELDNTLINERRFLSSVIADNPAQGEAELTQALGSIKGKNFEKLSPTAVIGLFGIVNAAFIAATANDGMKLVRSGVLEDQCEHCAEYMGAEYVWDGSDWVGEMPYKELPDSECYGRSRCRCFYIKLPLDEIRAMRELSE